MSNDPCSPHTARASIDEILRIHNDLKQEPHFQNMLEAFPTPAITMNTSRQIVGYNNHFVKIVPGQFLLGLRLCEFLSCEHTGAGRSDIASYDHCKFCGIDISLLQAESGITEVQECAINARNNGNVTALDFRLHTTPLTIRNHNIIIVSLTDITDEKWRLALERIFFHDVLNTAANIRSIAEMYHGIDETEHDSLMTNLNILSDRLIQEIIAHRDLLAAERNELFASRVAVSPTDILQHVETLYSYHPIALKKTIRVISDDNIPVMNTDPTLLGRVLGNLLKNALEASNKGEVVTLRCTKQGDEIHFTVHNTAVIPYEVSLHIFQRSFSTKAIGRGIGTYGARLLTERMLHGRIWFTSTRETGTEFNVAIPINAQIPERNSYRFL